MSKYRDRLQIIADILSIVSGGAKKTRIMYRAHLNYRLLCRYLGEVLEAGLVKFEDEGNYMLTARGKDFLIRHEEYSKRCKSLEEHLNHVNSEKMVLERMCSNASRIERNSGSRK